APSLREHICTTLDRPSVNKYWGTGSKNYRRHTLNQKELTLLKMNSRKYSAGTNLIRRRQPASPQGTDATESIHPNL
ncbi:MAG: hypothetical protein K2I26_10515, partial [Paramuribaculum sp.]|nr:hypothetical protein [Paramuribaculum sp.]